MLVIDRFEGRFAIVETASGMVNIPRADIPGDAKEGDVISLVLNHEQADTQAERVNKLADELFK